MHHKEAHRITRSGWLRAAVLGANGGIVSTASLIVGVAAAEAGRGNIVLAGVAGLTAGALSMAAGEYVSVKSQSDNEEADLAMDEKLAQEVARQMTAHNALEAHARDEIGISTALSANFDDAME
jgi:VIT1/CCC1 family predicted Fe2+/Mn2+ transporter